ncbi:hypothetical protein NE857_09305 [Nocardiopsis exhalans]|uniref:Uncharacterized protein n=1 Tax=Nocardiopsis exhalans TaxID=163604 RepID=A0ABY5DFD4_9ACTN|nr:hypothetical protein [Nocardiopsis exhalans]USY21778.1 hypothetical protein NE857_09305 [Nocardiopsis exhalans]
MTDITETTVYATASKALRALLRLEDDAIITREIMYRTADQDLQFKLALHYLEICQEIKKAERHYAHTTANLIVACRVLGKPITLPAA